jgi:ketosteroid isomerase-like protein
VRKSQANTVSGKDIDALKKVWADDVTLTFAGQAPIKGKPAVEAWYRSWFDGVKQIRETTTNVSVAKPGALTLTNTVLFESVTELVRLDDTRATIREAAAVDFRGGKITAVRVYVADPHGDKILSGG